MVQAHTPKRNRPLKLTRYLVYCIGILIAATLLPGCKNKGEATPVPPVVKKPPVVITDLGNGVNLQPSYANNGNVNFGWSLMKQYDKIKTVRIEIEPDKVAQGKLWIKQALENGYSVIATYHKSTNLGENDPNQVIAAANWWKTNYAALSSNGDITINLMNEWGNHEVTAKEYANAYNAGIAIIRPFYKGKIIIDIPGWGQETLTASQAVKGVVGVKITDPDIILSSHIYVNGYNKGRGRSVIASDMEDLVSTGLPCIIGEFGDNSLVASGSVDVAGVVRYAKTRGFKVYGWAWNGDGTKMNMVNPSWYDNGGATATVFTIHPTYFDIIYDLL
jgi:mannan endo-1,4-beta-mannosidase